MKINLSVILSLGFIASELYGAEAVVSNNVLIVEGDDAYLRTYVTRPVTLGFSEYELFHRQFEAIDLDDSDEEQEYEYHHKEQYVGLPLKPPFEIRRTETTKDWACITREIKRELSKKNGAEKERYMCHIAWLITNQPSRSKLKEVFLKACGDEESLSDLAFRLKK